MKLHLSLRLRLLCMGVAFLVLGSRSFAAQITAGTHHSVPAAKADRELLEKFLVYFDLPAAAGDAEARFRQSPRDATALFVRMETAELQERTDVVLDSALHLCSRPADPAIQELASNRILQHAGNIKSFNSVLPRVRSAAALNTACTFNLRLAVVAAAMDGHPKIDLEQAVRSAGLITRWRVAGPFGNYSNVDFERSWPAEIDQLARQRYGTESDAKKKQAADGDAASLTLERFWFRDGMLSLPEYFPPRGVFYAAGEIDTANVQPSQLDVLSAGSYAVFGDGRQALLHDSRYAAGSNRSSAVLRLRPGHHHILLKFTPDAVPLSVALHPGFTNQTRNSLLQMAHYTQELNAHFRGDFVAMNRMLQSDGAANPVLVQYLRALLYSAAEEHSPRADAAWKALAAEIG